MKLEKKIMIFRLQQTHAMKHFKIFSPSPDSSIPTCPHEIDVPDKITSKDLPSTSNTDRNKTQPSAMFISFSEEKKLVSSSSG